MMTRRSLQQGRKESKDSLSMDNMIGPMAMPLKPNRLRVPVSVPSASKPNTSARRTLKITP